MAQALTRVLLAGTAAFLLLSPAAMAQPGRPDSVSVVAGPRYARGGVYRFFFGDHYRDLWTTPIRVPVLDLGGFAGGLTPVREGGGMQTKSLRLNGADGRQYTFRSVDKDPTAALPPDLRDTFADRIFQDQISSGHPAGALVVSPILEAAGVLHARPRLVVMPDDPALGEFRAAFANLLGMIEERPRDADEEDISFAGALEIVSTPDLIDEVEENPSVRVDARAFLRARLTDVFLGDWDRHQDQWRWARVEDRGGQRWLPIPRDRDQAFVRFDGFLLGVVREQVPQLVNFGPDYPELVGATWNGRDLDRRLLTELEWAAWDSVATDLQQRLNDAVLAEAVGLLPPEYQPIDGPRLRAALLARRDELRRMARRYYELLATQVDVHASDRDDRIRVERLDDRSVEVTVGNGEPWYRRRFDRGETTDIRIYMHGGADHAVVTGRGRVGTTVRLIGGGGDDRFDDSSRAGSTHFYDDRGQNVAFGGAIDDRPYRATDDPDDPKALPHRDWGRKAVSFPFASVGPDAGVLLGWGGRFTRFSFRKKPWSSRLSYSAVVATGAGTGRLDVRYRIMGENSRSFWSIAALASGIEVLRWHGFGNGTTIDPDQPSSYYRAAQHQILLEPSFGWALGERSTVRFGPRLKYSVTELDDGQNAARFIGTDRPFGTEAFAQVGVGAELDVDTRDIEGAATRGIHLQLAGRFLPSILDVPSSFGSISAQATTYLSAPLPLSPTLALHAGGMRIFGTSGRIPFHEAASLGSGSTLRGFRTGRFAGDEGAVWASAELRLSLTRLFILVPGRQGIFGFYDGGRVYHRADPSSADEWHQSVGGGLWMSFLTPGSLLSVGLGHSREGNRVHARVGFAF